MKVILRLALLGTTLLLPITQQSLAAETTRLESTGSLGTKAVLELRQSPLTVMKATPFALHATPTLPPSPAVREILCDLTMPAMPMPLNQPKVERSGNDFTGTLVFTMAGAWQAEFVIPLPGGKEERFIFDIPQVLLK